MSHGSESVADEAAIQAAGPATGPGSVPDSAGNGSVKVTNEVIASIAALAACEIDGVAATDEASARHFADWVRRDTSHRGVRVSIDEDRAVHLEVFVRVASTVNVPRIAEAVQDNVEEAISRMLNLEIAAIDVFVSGVTFSN